MQNSPKKSSWLWLAWKCSLSKLHSQRGRFITRGCPSPTLQLHSSAKGTGWVQKGFPISNGPCSYPWMVTGDSDKWKLCSGHPRAQPDCCPEKSKDEILDMINILLHGFCPDSEVMYENITSLRLQQRKISPWHAYSSQIACFILMA